MISILLHYLPVWTVYLSGGIFVLILLVTSGIAIGKSGRHPIWALALLVPYGQIVVFWLWAYTPWPTGEFRGEFRKPD